MHLVNRFVIPFVIGGLPAFTRFYLSSLPSTHPPTSLQVASSPLRPAFPASRLRRLRTALVYTRSFFPQSSYLSTRSSTRTTNPIKTLDTNIIFYPFTSNFLPRTFYAWLPTVCSPPGTTIRAPHSLSRYSSPPAPSASPRLYSHSCS